LKLLAAAPANPREPANLLKWNWGAFFFSWIWGIANGVRLAWFALIPVIGVAVAVELGRTGNERAWRGKKWPGPEEFEKTQGRWSAAALCSLAVVAAGLLVWLVGSAVNASHASGNVNKIIGEAMRIPALRQVTGGGYTVKAVLSAQGGQVLCDVETGGVVYNALIEDSGKSVSMLRSGMGKSETLSAPARKAFAKAESAAGLVAFAGPNYRVDEEVWLCDGERLSVGFGILGANAYYYLVCDLLETGEPSSMRLLLLGDDLAYQEIWRSAA
jgi:hypothetical protein